jgi:hypothetical protein
MIPPKFQAGQKVSIRLDALVLLREFGARRPVEGAVLEVRTVRGKPLYQVGGQIGHEPDDLWNLDLREDDLADAGGERINVWASSPPSPMTARQRPTA